MLIDELLSTKAIGNIHGDVSQYNTKHNLRNAQKFELAPDFCAAAEQLMVNYDAIAHAIPLCRLPYPLTWIEVAQQHRARFLRAPMHIPEMQTTPHRVGFLLSAVGETGFVAHEFWNFKNNPQPIASHIAMEFDVTKRLSATPIEADAGAPKMFFKTSTAEEWQKASPIARGQISSITIPIAPFYSTGVEKEIMRVDNYGRFLFELGAADWSGESVFLLAVLALLNTVNAHTRDEHIINAKFNKRRVANNKTPLANYYTLAIHPRLKRYIVRGGGDSSSNYAELRAHMVRGHWKVRKTGIFFWHPHVRGKAEHGTIDKSYSVE